jgi:effector-binding domain-containing protein
MVAGWKVFSVVLVLGLGTDEGALAQTAPAQAPAAPSQPAPASPAQPAPPPAASSARPVLVPGAGDTDVAEVTLPGKPAAIISGTSKSEEGFTTIREAFRKLEEELGKAGIAPAGRPLAIFQQFNPDGSFQYDALIPIARPPDGKTLLFTHKNAYDEVESTYDMIEIYLEAKGIAVQDPIIEEFVNDPKDASDAELELNIFVQPK